MSNAYLNHLQRIACKYMFKGYIVKHNGWFFAGIYPILKSKETVFCSWNEQCKCFSSKEELEINLHLKFPSSIVNDKDQPPPFVEKLDCVFNDDDIKFYEIKGITEHVLKEHVQNCMPLI